MIRHTTYTLSLFIFLIQACGPQTTENQANKETLETSKQSISATVCWGGATGGIACGWENRGCFSNFGSTVQWYSLADNTSTCCYESGHANCNIGAVDDDGTVRKTKCDTEDRYGTRLKPCGLGCILASAECTASLARCDYVVINGETRSYAKLCPGNFCANNCALARCQLEGKALCGNDCYHPSTEQCIDGTKVCPIDSESTLCGGQCWNASTQKCIDNKVCARADENTLCGGQCWNASTQKCIGNKVCSRSDENTLCGGQCWRESAHNCIGNIRCDNAHDGICGGICYTKSVNRCVMNKLCDVTDTHLCNNQCYNRMEEICVDSRHICNRPKDSWNACAGCYQQRAGELGSRCHINDQCRVGQCSGTGLPFCAAGRCVCANDNDCGIGRYCNKGVLGVGTNACRSKRSNGTSCTRRGQCFSGRCYWGFCRACNRNSHCPSGQTCQSGTCR